jgi:outer membrane receptor protein involved in Fe transport
MGASALRGAARRLSQIAAVACLAATSIARAADGDASPPTRVEEVVVTGSRLPSRADRSDHPVSVLGVEEIKRSATLTLDTLLDQLPGVTPSYSSASNNPSKNGASFVNLRDLGIGRTLVLLNGKRIVGGDSTNAVDLNTIPPSLVDRIELSTGGASAVYGPDAVAGVVNIHLNTGFDGLRIEGRTLVSQRGDGQEHEASLAAGRSVGPVHLSLGFSFSQRDGIGKGDRPFSALADSPVPAIPGGGWLIGPNSPSQAAVDSVFARYGVPAGSVSARLPMGFNSDGTLFAIGRPGDPQYDAQNYRGSLDRVATNFYPDVYSYNYQPDNKLILPQQRYSGALFVDAPFSAATTAYLQLVVTQYSTATSLAATPAPTDPNPILPGADINAFIIPVTNPFIPADLAQLLASRTGDTPALPGAGPTEDFLYRFRTTVLGPRQSDDESRMTQAIVGLKHDFGRDWQGELSGSFGWYDRTETQQGLLNVPRLQQLLLSPTGGTEFCAGGFNPFPATLSPSCRDYVSSQVSFTTALRQQDIVATLSGPVFQAPAGPVRALVGGEYRRVSLAFQTPADIAPGEVAGFQPAVGYGGAIEFAEGFAEATAPLVKDWPLARRVDLTLGFRHSEDLHAAGSDSWKAELGWTIDEAVRLRAAYQRAVRSPDIFERFEPPYESSAVMSDPCSPGFAARTPQIASLCEQQARALGFSPDVLNTLNPSDYFSVINGGSRSLAPERARTITVGAVWTGSPLDGWIERAQASVDWYDITLNGAIGYADPQVAVNACYNIGGGNPSYDPASPACAGVPRSTLDFTLSDVSALETNQSLLSTGGLDMAASFRTDLARITGRPWLGRLDFGFQLDWLAFYRVKVSPIAPLIDYAGTISDGVTAEYETLPRWKGLVSVAWASGPAQVSITGRIIDGMDNRATRDGAGVPSTGVGPASYWDLATRWRLNRRVELRAGILNLFDLGPQIYSPSIDANTDPSTYDVIGRRYWVGLALTL